MRNNPAMLEAAKRDRTEMDKHDDTNYRDIRPQEAFNRAQFGHNLPYLPYPLDYMGYSELVDWTRDALVADANSRGLKNKTVKWGDQSGLRTCGPGRPYSTLHISHPNNQARTILGPDPLLSSSGQLFRIVCEVLI